MSWELVSAILGVVAIIASIKFVQVKALLKEFAEAVVVISSALEDDTVTVEEGRKIVEECMDVVNASIKLVSKK